MEKSHTKELLYILLLTATHTEAADELCEQLDAHVAHSPL
jgi:hypothetical protein